MSKKSNLSSISFNSENKVSASVLPSNLSSDFGPPNDEDKFVVFCVDGGIGKNIAATASVSAIAKHYPDRKVIVLGSWPDIWINNPYVYRFFRPGMTPYFYYDFIKNRDTIILKHEAYLDEDYFYRRKFIGEIFCDMYDIPFNNELPKLFLTPTEKNIGYSIVKQQPKPVLILQSFGGPPPQNGLTYSWYRDLSPDIAQTLVNTLSQKYSVLQLRYKEQPQLENTLQVDMPLRGAMSLIEQSSARLFIDSFGQHAATAFGLKSTVCWVGTSSKVFGYDSNYNIQTKYNFSSYKDVDALFEPFPIGPQPHQCPEDFDPNQSFDIQEILNTFNL
jgi:hypothetical protein